MNNYSDVIILGAGAAGLFCASQAAKLGKQVTLLDNGKKIGRKILMSGGGFCNFTNLEVTPQHYLSQNPHFVKSALARYTQWDFIAMVASYGIAYHEKELGQLFTDEGAEKIVDMLATECANYQVNIQLRQQVSDIRQLNQADAEQGRKGRFALLANGTTWYCDALVIATGGLSMPGLGATPFGYQVAEQFGIKVLPPRASLVPFTWREADKAYTTLSGVALPIVVTANGGKSFSNQMLFTHRGISGPAILQISNYWQPNESVEINLLPHQDIAEFLQQLRTTSPKLQLKNALARVLPKKLVEVWSEQQLIQDEPIAQLSKVRLQQLSDLIHHWQFLPNGTEGYRTAEVTMGGVDTRAVSSKTMEAQSVKGLYFIGEVLDVTGWLGGYNFQWAWSSAYACAMALVDDN
ncbi:TPA: NAD(P)/FAD-dependent oxidoreductase [Pasteurella multocida]|uniref:NAD(P)/FAD-dependent oxidoreductase n=1 Tax=Pasteurella multocida TaxID=747 RepID=UPI0028DED3C5|nr:NAD(P)/FAD-dependent oxidoreductase [Pasteurella multocida]MDY0498386.1 NAD(P)/FAD-dependent oxidoreductase [Pasteurella multocida]MDY0655049.1 NAD(P)/FAD-dependent oxidoreductase [Pasteurella multocida]WRU41339.1 NAD(P)/FAD-dependent oxidoreductase [Pasteurella multocida]HDR1919836.1 NAD(P)/FAD-dependent oxidoreductase [Pasteurella multocida]HEA3244252.1 NAD(P)/FAD-dependent oxidoreductase [Pasteurella multocida]